MNPNTPRPGHLFFTPRTPWGTRAGQQSFRQHQRASEDARADADEKHLLWGKEQQGLGAQMATEKSPWRNGAERTLDKQGVPRSLSGQLPPPAQPSGAAWQVPHSDLQPYQQQPAARPVSEITRTVAAPANPATAEQMSQAGDAYRSTPQAKGPLGRLLEHFDGGASYEGRHPGTEEPPDKEWWLRYSSNPKAREDLPNFDAPERHEGDESKWRSLNPDKEPEYQKPQDERPKKAVPGSRR